MWKICFLKPPIIYSLLEIAIKRGREREWKWQTNRKTDRQTNQWQDQRSHTSTLYGPCIAYDWESERERERESRRRKTHKFRWNLWLVSLKIPNMLQIGCGWFSNTYSLLSLSLSLSLSGYLWASSQGSGFFEMI